MVCAEAVELAEIGVTGLSCREAQDETLYDTAAPVLNVANKQRVSASLFSFSSVCRLWTLTFRENAE
jgi:hypothetical protein